MDDDDVDPFFEALIQARTAQEQRLVALLDLQLATRARRLPSARL